MTREIMKSIFNGDIQGFDALVHQGSVDVRMVTEPDRWNFLHRALLPVSMTADPRMISHLIKCGVPINNKDQFGNTPLYYAARSKSTELIRLLLDAGAELDPVNEDGVTPLRELLVRKPLNFDAIELLLSRGADKNQCVEGGITVNEYANIIAHDGNHALRDLFNKYEKS